MKLLREGDTSRAICETCGSIQPTTYRRRTVPFRHREGQVSGVLVGVCNACDTVVSIPQQSVPRITKELDRQRHALEARLSNYLLDALNVTLTTLEGASTPRGFAVLLRYYLDWANKNPEALTRLKQLAGAEEARGKAVERLSVKLDDRYADILANLVKDSGLNKTSVVKSIVVQAKRDVLDDENPGIRDDLASYLHVAGW